MYNLFWIDFNEGRSSSFSGEWRYPTTVRQYWDMSVTMSTGWTIKLRGPHWYIIKCYRKNSACSTGDSCLTGYQYIIHATLLFPNRNATALEEHHCLQIDHSHNNWATQHGALHPSSSSTRRDTENAQRWHGVSVLWCLLSHSQRN